MSSIISMIYRFFFSKIEILVICRPLQNFLNSTYWKITSILEIQWEICINCHWQFFGWYQINRRSRDSKIHQIANRKQRSVIFPEYAEFINKLRSIIEEIKYSIQLRWQLSCILCSRWSRIGLIVDGNWNYNNCYGNFTHVSNGRPKK